MLAPSDLRSVSLASVDGQGWLAASSGDGAKIGHLDALFDVGALHAPVVTRAQRFSSDEYREQDAFERGVLARHLHGVAGQPIQADAQTNGRTAITSVDGKWGSGKSTLACLFVDEMRSSSPNAGLPYDPVVVHFDAWRQAVVAPQWWSLAAALNRGVRRERSWLVRLAMSVSGAIGRVFSSAATMAALALTTASLVIVALARDSSSGSFAGALASVQATLTVVIALYAFVSVGTRSLFWTSSTFGRLHLRADDDPLGDIAEKVSRLRRWSPPQGAAARRPILLVVDDLDRCDASTVVATMSCRMR